MATGCGKGDRGKEGARDLSRETLSIPLKVGGRVVAIDGRDGDRGGVGNATYGTEGMGKGRMRKGRAAKDGRDGEHKGGGCEEGVSKSRLT